MKKLFLYIFEPFNNLSKRLYITIITVLFLAAFILFIGVFSNVINTDDMTLSLRNNETYFTYRQMYIDMPLLDHFTDKPMIHEELNYMPWERRLLIELQTDDFICDLYNMQNDDFIMEVVYSVGGYEYPYFDSGNELVNEAFFEHEYLPIFKGRGITKEDFDEILNAESPYMIINVIAGYSFSEDYELGDIIRHPDEYMIEYNHGSDLSDYSLGVGDQDCFGYRIVGFIEKGATYANPSGGIHSTDGFVFVPYIPEISIFFPELREKGFFVAYNIPTWKFLIRSGKAEEYAEIINEKLNGLFIDKYYDLNDSANNTRAILDEVVSVRNDSFIAIAVILLIFSVSGIIVSTVNKFKKNIRSYTVHLTVGATNNDIYIFSAVEMLMQITIAFAIAHIPYILGFVTDIPVLRFINRNIPYMRSSAMYLLILLFALIFIAVTVAVTAWCVNKYSIAETLKGKE